MSTPRVTYRQLTPTFCPCGRPRSPDAPLCQRCTDVARPRSEAPWSTPIRYYAPPDPPVLPAIATRPAISRVGPVDWKRLLEEGTE